MTRRRNINLVNMRDSAVYRAMFRDVIKNQIQTLMDQLSHAGEESLLLTACLTDADPDDSTIASSMGHSFLKHQTTEYQSKFREYCLQKLHNMEGSQSGAAGSGMSDSHSSPEVPVTRETSKRRLNTENGEEEHKSVEEGVERKRPRVATPVVKAEMEQGESTSVKSNNGQDTILPKGHHKCSMCSYISKFKANVSRHERSIHGLNLEGTSSPSVQYACALCHYKSLYRSNLMRHEKNVHKLESTSIDMEARRIPIDKLAYQQALTMEAPVDEALYSPQEGVFHSPLDSEETNYHMCNYCQQVCPTIQVLREHIETVHLSQTNMTCEKCGQDFENVILLQEHMATHEVKQHEKCVCGKTFQYRTSLIRHEKKCKMARSSQEEEEVGQGTSEQEMNSETSRDGLEQETSQAGSVESDLKNEDSENGNGDGLTSGTWKGDISRKSDSGTSFRTKAGLAAHDGDGFKLDDKQKQNYNDRKGCGRYSSGQSDCDGGHESERSDWDKSAGMMI